MKKLVNHTAHFGFVLALFLLVSLLLTMFGAVYFLKSYGFELAVAVAVFAGLYYITRDID